MRHLIKRYGKNPARPEKRAAAHSEDAGKADATGEPTLAEKARAAGGAQFAPRTRLKPDRDEIDALAATASAMRALDPRRAHFAEDEACDETCDEAPRAARECLVVDDSRVVRKLVRAVAEEMGFGVREAEDGEEALILCAQAMPNLIVTDWQMPRLSGIELVAKLRAIAGKSDVRVIFCTSRASEQDIRDGVAAGADDYILKPFDKAVLRAKIAQSFPGEDMPRDAD